MRFKATQKWPILPTAAKTKKNINNSDKNVYVDIPQSPLGVGGGGTQESFVLKKDSFFRWSLLV